MTLRKVAGSMVEDLKPRGLAPCKSSFGDTRRPGARRRSGRIVMRKNLFGGILAATALAMLGSSALAEPEIVSGPPAEPECFVPWRAETAFFKFPAKEGPYRLALANGYIANTWRIQMVQTAKAYAAQPEVAAKLKEFKVVSTGEDVPAQDRKSTRLNSSHVKISYAVFCLKQKKVHIKI